MVDRAIVRLWIVGVASVLALASPSGCSSDTCQQQPCATAGWCDAPDECTVDGAKFQCVMAECYGASLSAGTHTLKLHFQAKPPSAPPDFQMTFGQPVGMVTLTAGSYACSGGSSATVLCRGVPLADATVTVVIPAGSPDVTMGMQWVDQACLDQNASCAK